MALLDKPVSMNELGAAVVQDIGSVAQTKLSQEKGDLSAVWESMYTKSLGRKVSSQCYYTTEDIERAQKEETEKATSGERQESIKEQHEPEATKQKQTKPTQAEKDSQDKRLKDLASVHFERALNTGRAHWHNEGRHFRRRRTLSGEFSNSDPTASPKQIARHRSADAP